jgi:hypothetical protein
MAHHVGKAEGAWRERLVRFQDSGLTIGAFCEREGVSVSNFQAWKRRLGIGKKTPSSRQLTSGRSGAEPLFVPLNLNPGVSAADVRIVLPGGAVVHVPLHADDRVLVCLIEAAARISQEGAAC